MRALPSVGVLTAIALAAAACAGGHKSIHVTTSVSPGPKISVRTMSSSGLILEGRARCTASVTTPVEAGHEIAVTFSLHNLSESVVKAPVAEGSVWLVIRSADGITYNTRTALSAELSHGGPFRTPVRIPPGETRTVGGAGDFVRWQGPLRIRPGCEDRLLPALDVGVTAPGPPLSNQTAIADVVAATGHLLDHCRPQESGVPVEGTIEPPSGGGPSMDAECSVSLHGEGRFVVAQVLVLIPPDMRGVRVRQPYETLSFPKRRRPYEAIAWELVVTRDGAVTVAGFTHDATRAANRMAPEWNWSGSQWSQPGSARCGFEGFGGGPMLDLISVCPS